MKVLESYILRRTTIVFVAALFWTLAIVWTTQVLARIDLVTDSGQSALTFFKVASYVLPTVIPIVVPFAMVIGIAQTLSAMNTDSELVVISAAGASRTTVVRPIVILAVLASFFSLFVGNIVEPYARLQNRELVASARADLISLLIQEGTFRKVDNGLFVQISERLPDGGLGGVFVADSREKNIDLIYYAKEGAFVDRDGRKMLVMNDGVIQRKAPGGEVSVIRFTSYAFDMSEFTNAANEITMYPKDRTTGYLLDPPSDDRMYQKVPQQFRAELHRRFSDWLYPLAFALISIAVAGDARSHREARLHPMLTAIMLTLGIRWLGFFVANESESQAWLIYIVYGVPIVTSLVASWFIITHRTLEIPASLTNRLADVFAAVSSRFAGLLGRKPRTGAA
ncbi:LPS export ABC transporter permease LptF [Oryzicola mucosus]|uniref:LPS export ABC transporter permease LptF n=1 Tax=Oryzicola mucosus TaxID=2767425 RepID=A0A8J6PWY6_9HYPH|nr:LPS export ABC transporter permease LptF [Oryzicola mucosus]MBD0415778.1 LPS export ABC transporter permease LptF [Oryzicola mucosus]